MKEITSDWICPNCLGAGCPQCNWKGGGQVIETWYTPEEARHLGLPIPDDCVGFVVRRYPDGVVEEEVGIREVGWVDFSVSYPERR